MQPNYIRWWKRGGRGGVVIVLRSKAQYSACVEQKQPPPDSFQQTHPAISQNSLQMQAHIPKIKDKKKILLW